jgi:hypothetical protein
MKNQVENVCNVADGFRVITSTQHRNKVLLYQLKIISAKAKIEQKETYFLGAAVHLQSV